MVTGGLGAQAMLGAPPGYADPLHPTAAELRRAALFLRSSGGQGFGRIFGPNIDPATIEDALLAHPKVTAAAAVGRPDPHAGEVPVAFVTLLPGSDVGPRALQSWAADHVPERAAAPKQVEIVESIPLTSVGKQYKPELRRRAAEQAARAALAGTAAADRVSAVLEDGSIEIHVPRVGAEDEVRSALSQYAWKWRYQ